MTLEDKNSPKIANIYNCLFCDYQCCKLCDYKKHKLTLKHKKNDAGLQKNDALSPKIALPFNCICGKKYNYRQGLWKHKKICSIIFENKEQQKGLNFQIDKYKDKDAIMVLVQQNNDFKELLLEQNKMIMEICKNKSVTNYTSNSNNKTFNLNVFLNEQCKDAMNIMDFVDSLKLQLSDLENIGKIGFVEGISNIIIKNLKNLDITQRPIHCSDSKREVMYVKDDNEWYNDSKEGDEENKKLKKAIKHIAHKNSKNISLFKEKYPDCIYSDSKKSDQYNKIIIEAFGGIKNEDMNNENKIIKKIAKEVSIDKFNLL